MKKWLTPDLAHALITILHVTVTVYSVVVLTTMPFSAVTRFFTVHEDIIILIFTVIIIPSSVVACFSGCADEPRGIEMAGPVEGEAVFAFKKIAVPVGLIIAGAAGICALLNSPLRFSLYRFLATCPLFAVPRYEMSLIMVLIFLGLFMIMAPRIALFSYSMADSYFNKFGRCLTEDNGATSLW